MSRAIEIRHLRKVYRRGLVALQDLDLEVDEGDVMESQGIPWTQERDILPIYRTSTLLDPTWWRPGTRPPTTWW